MGVTKRMQELIDYKDARLRAIRKSHAETADQKFSIDQRMALYPDADPEWLLECRDRSNLLGKRLRDLEHEYERIQARAIETFAYNLGTSRWR